MYEEMEAWRRFAQTGCVEDYMKYRAWHTHTPAVMQEGWTYAPQHGGTDHPGTEYR